MSDALPSTDRPLTDDERLRAACDWSDYRKDYGADPDDTVRGKEHQAFLAGWTARHRESALPTAADQPTTEPSALVPDHTDSVDEPTLDDWRQGYKEQHQTINAQHRALLDIWRAVEPGDTRHITYDVDDPSAVLRSVLAVFAPAPQPTVDDERDERLARARRDIARIRDVVANRGPLAVESILAPHEQSLLALDDEVARLRAVIDDQAETIVEREAAL